MSSFDQRVGDWRSGGGDQIRAEYQAQLQKQADSYVPRHGRARSNRYAEAAIDSMYSLRIWSPAAFCQSFTS
jgi:hypothetical protein